MLSWSDISRNKFQPTTLKSLLDRLRWCVVTDRGSSIDTNEKPYVLGFPFEPTAMFSFPCTGTLYLRRLRTSLLTDIHLVELKR